MVDSALGNIPKRALFKASEVCDLIKVQPYVLRTWEAEFPQLGLSKTAGGPRVYRRSDVEQVARIKHLLLVEGLTLAGARRRLDEESTPMSADTADLNELFGQNARERLTEVKRGLRSILELLSGTALVEEFRLGSPAVVSARRATPTARSRPSGKIARARGTTAKRR
jgi:DNA-binding transcriptional MerR regulator